VDAHSGKAWEAAAMSQQRITDEVTVITNCCDDIEIKTGQGCDEWGFSYSPLTNDEMQSLVLFWLRELPEDQRVERLRQITEAVTQEEDNDSKWTLNIPGKPMEIAGWRDGYVAIRNVEKSDDKERA
jgi:hypothetical protein